MQAVHSIQEKLTKYKYLAEQIEYHINHNNIDKAKPLLKKYADEISNSNTYAFQGIINFQEGNFEAAIDVFENGIKEHPFNFSLHFNLAFIYGVIQKFDESFKNYFYAIKYSLTDQEKQNALSGFKDVSKLAIDGGVYSEVDLQSKIKELEKILQQRDGRVYPIDVDGVSMIRKPQQIGTPDEYMVNMYKTLSVQDVNVQTRMFFKSELIKGKVLQGERKWKTKGPVVFPVSRINHKIPIEIKVNDETYTFSEKHLTINQFNYIRISEPGTVRVSATEEIFVGEPIDLGPEEKPVKLVLKLFIDGLSYQFLEDVGLDKVMPNTYEFFKEGLISTNCNTVSEWTLPSMASINTGMYPNRHKMLQPEHSFSFSKSHKMLTEYYKEAGYYCTDISGNWRTTPPLGYSRGYDRMIYQNFMGGFDAREVIMEGIEHLTSFSESNNFLTMTLMDLHNVPDEIENHLYSQVHTDITDKINKNKKGITSVQTKYDKNKIKKYFQEIKRIDNLLAILYDFILKEYKTENIVIVLHSDHGQSFLDNTFDLLGDHRIRVPFMMRGRNIRPGISDRLVETIDILPSMLYCSSMEVPIDINGQVIKMLGGEHEREFTFSQIIHPNQPYRVRIKEETQSYYFDTEYNVSSNLKINLERYKSKIIDNKTNMDITGDNDQMKNQYDNFVLKSIKNML